MIAFTVTVSVAGIAHWPVVGVNVYVVVPGCDVFMVDGFHVPVMPLLDVVGNIGAVAFWHNALMAVNVGMSCGLMVMFNVVGVAHWPVVGVNVYIVVPGVDVFMVDGFQVPVMPLLDVVGNAGAVVFWHNGPMAVNDGVSRVVMVMSIVVVVPH